MLFRSETPHIKAQILYILHFIHPFWQEPAAQQGKQQTTLLGSMNIKPSQKKASEEAAIPFGCEIAKFEEEEPIIEPDKSFEDVDGIRKNVLSWFLGSLCKTAGIKNRYSKYFEEEIEKYTVERPEYSEDDEEDAENIKPPDGGEPDG